MIKKLNTEVFFVDFEWIRTFILAADQGNFRKTAEMLYVSQPTVTVHIKQLEKELGFSLFNRTNKKVLLTEEGRNFLTHAKKMMHVYQDGLKDAQAISQGYRTKFSIAISPLLAETILPFVLKQYVNSHPEVEISVNIVESTLIEQAVLDEQVDIGLSCLPASDSSLRTELFYEDEVIFVMAHDGFDSETAPAIDVEEVVSTNYLITGNHPSYWKELMPALRLRYPKIKTMHVTQTHISKRFIVEGLGVSFLPLSSCRRELAEGRLMSAEWSEIELPSANAYAILKYSNSMEEEFLEFISGYRYT
ncbi:LysR family transcriptional regulator [Radiobacillus sp. PE A8.2]|uniref:LysR family transcriptional regulator n=1 Tax=Radiobacillus sp. PE A8.2 TaxID=3380349 RepID=UPI00388FE88B